jgi:hypothetical protein
VDLLRVEEDALGRRRFSRVNMGDDTDIPRSFE